MKLLLLNRFPVVFSNARPYFSECDPMTLESVDGCRWLWFVCGSSHQSLIMTQHNFWDSCRWLELEVGPQICSFLSLGWRSHGTLIKKEFLGFMSLLFVAFNPATAIRKEVGG